MAMEDDVKEPDRRGAWPEIMLDLVLDSKGDQSLEAMVIGSVTIHSDSNQGCEKIVLEKSEEKMIRYLKPLYIKVHMEGQPINKVLVDNGMTINIISVGMMRRLNKESDLISTKVIANNFSSGVTVTKGAYINWGHCQ